MRLLSVEISKDITLVNLIQEEIKRRLNSGPEPFVLSSTV
jgi:hypothetical protein